LNVKHIFARTQIFKIIYAVDTRYRIVPLNSLKHPKYHLKAPIYVTLEFEEDKVVAISGGNHRMQIGKIKAYTKGFQESYKLSAVTEGLRNNPEKKGLI